MWNRSERCANVHVCRRAPQALTFWTRVSVGVIGQKRPNAIHLESATYDCSEWFGWVETVSIPVISLVLNLPGLIACVSGKAGQAPVRAAASAHPEIVPIEFSSTDLV
jgi:hypothetical protein